MVTKTIDWEGVELEYRAGLRTLRDIASEYGITHGAIRKRAERDKWERDLSAKVRAAAEALVSKAAVSKDVPKVSKATERELIESNARMQADVILSHRTDAKAIRDKVNAYREELDACGEDLPKRVSILKALGETLKTAVTIEREAFGIKDSKDFEAERQIGAAAGMSAAEAYAAMCAAGK